MSMVRVVRVVVRVSPMRTDPLSPAEGPGGPGGPGEISTSTSCVCAGAQGAKVEVRADHPDQAGQLDFGVSTDEGELLDERRCAGCGCRIESKHQSVAGTTRSGVRPHAGRGLCTTCYARARKAEGGLDRYAVRRRSNAACKGPDDRCPRCSEIEDLVQHGALVTDLPDLLRITPATLARFLWRHHRPRLARAVERMVERSR